MSTATDNVKPNPEDSLVKWGPVAAVLVSVGAYFGGQIIGYLFLVFIFSIFWTLKVSATDPAGLLANLKDIFDQFFRQVDAMVGLEIQSSALLQFTLIFMIEAVTVGLLYLFMRKRKAGFRSIGLIKPRLGDAGYALMGLSVYLPIYLASIFLISRLIPAIDLNQKQQLGFDDASTPPELLLVMVSLVILPPLVEEILARGFLYSGLKTKLPKIGAAIITSVLFAVAHLQAGSGAPLLWVAAIDTFILSMVLVYLRELTGGLWSSIGLHMLKNGLAFFLVFILRIG